MKKKIKQKFDSLYKNWKSSKQPVEQLIFALFKLIHNKDVTYGTTLELGNDGYNFYANGFIVDHIKFSNKTISVCGSGLQDPNKKFKNVIYYKSITSFEFSNKILTICNKTGKDSIDVSFSTSKSIPVTVNYDKNLDYYDTQDNNA